MMRSRASPIRSASCGCFHHDPVQFRNEFQNTRMLYRQEGFYPYVITPDEVDDVKFTIVNFTDYKVSDMSPSRTVGESEVNSEIEVYMYSIFEKVRPFDEDIDELWPDAGEAEWEEYNRTNEMDANSHLTDGSHF
jgi:hypothetical protein